MSHPITTLIPYMAHHWVAPTVKQDATEKRKDYTLDRKIKRTKRSAGP